MREIQVEVGSNWVGKLGGNLDTKIKIRYVTQVEGNTFFTYEKTERDYSGKTVTRLATAEREAFLAAYTEKESFFKVGGQYKANGYTYYVQEVYAISNPVNEHHRKQARAIIIDSNGKRWMEMLNKYDFTHVTRVK